MKWILPVSVVFLIAGFLRAEEKEAEFYWHGRGESKIVALTIDDGPSTATSKLLELLSKKNVKATFFVLGSNVERFPEEVKEIDKKGHELGNHTYSHINFSKYKGSGYRNKLASEITKTGQALRELTGKNIEILRMPHGYTRQWVRETACSLDMMLVNWSFGCDWQKLNEEEMLQSYIKAVEPGAVLLFHDSASKTDMRLKIISKLIDCALEQGYRFVTVSEMFSLRK